MIINRISVIQTTYANAIVDFLKANLPSVASGFFDQQMRQQMAVEKQRIALKYEKQEAELKRSYQAKITRRM